MLWNDPVLAAACGVGGLVDALEACDQLRPAQKARLAELQTKVGASANLTGREANWLLDAFTTWFGRTYAKSA